MGARQAARGSRGDFDTKDLVQEAALRMLKRRFLFEPRHAHAVQAYMRRTVMNLVRDEAGDCPPARVRGTRRQTPCDADRTAGDHHQQ